MAIVTAPPTAPAWATLIESGVRQAGQEDLGRLTAGELGDGVVALLRLVDLLQAEGARRLRRFEETGGPGVEGAASTVAWVSGRCRRSPGSAADLVCVGRQLEALPETARALRAGEIGYQHASVIAHLARQVGDEAAAALEPELVAAAREADVQRFGWFARRVREVVDPDGALGDANRDHARSRMHLSQTLGGSWRMDGWLDVEGGAMLSTALTPLMKPVPGDRRTASQRRAEALVELCRRQLDGGGLPTTGGERPHLHLTVSAETLRGEPGSPGGMLRGVGPVVGETARRLACDATLIEEVVGPGGEPVAAERRGRTVPAAVRRGLLARDGGCRFRRSDRPQERCDRPAEWCDGHHVQYQSLRGPHILINLALLCRFHHRMVHEGGWRIVLGADGELDFVPPGGRSP